MGDQCQGMPVSSVKMGEHPNNRGPAKAFLYMSVVDDVQTVIVIDERGML
jgi:hypothetical protein